MRRGRKVMMPALLLALLGPMSAPVRASDDLLIFSDFNQPVYGTMTFNNGWQNNSWGPAYVTNSPVHSGTSALCLAPSGGWQAMRFIRADTDTAIYTNVTLWINGGATGGQTVGIDAVLGGTGQNRISVGINGRLPTNSWLQVTLPLASLGAAGQTNFEGIEIWSNTGNTQAPFFVDDVTLVAAPAPPVVRVGVNAAQSVRTVDAKVFGINQVAWDGNVDTPMTVGILNDLGNPCLRWPGGSWGDSYFMTNELQGWGSRTTNFIHVATNTHAQVFFIVNYGSGTPQQAADWVRMCNVTNHGGFKYWEVGNEVGGGWEEDDNTNAPWQAHDPWTYALRFTDYYNRMKAVDATIKVGAVADITEDGTSNYTNHPVINPRTGVAHNGWTPVMLTYMRSNGITPDFLVEHKYAPGDGDTYNLLWSRTWASDAAGLRQMVTDYLGDAGTNVTLECTENGCGGDRQRVSLVGGLFYADTIGQIMQTEFNSRLWWDTRNGRGDITNSDPAYYGWRTNADGNYTYDEGIVYNLGAPTNRYPAYYVAKLMPFFAGGGDTVVPVTNDYPLLGTYAVRRTNGCLTLLVINKSSSYSLAAAVKVSGYLPLASATAYGYGLSQDSAARTGTGSADIVQSNFPGAGVSFTNTFAPYSVTVLVFNPAPMPTLVVQPVAAGKFIFQLQGQPGASYVLQSSTNLAAAWTSVSTNTLAAGTQNFTNSILARQQFWRAMWKT